MSELFIVNDANGDPTLWRANGDHPVALLRESDVAPEVWAIVAAACPAPGTQPTPDVQSVTESPNKGAEMLGTPQPRSEAVKAMTTDERAATAPLDEFIAAYESDDNEWWGIGCGHHQNLFDAAVDARNEARAERDALHRQLAELREVADEALGQLRNVLSEFYERGHPGYDGIRTGWVHTTTHKARWRVVSDLTAALAAASVSSQPETAEDVPQPTPRCKHGHTERHPTDDSDQDHMRWCPGPGPVAATAKEAGE